MPNFTSESKVGDIWHQLINQSINIHPYQYMNTVMMYAK